LIDRFIGVPRTDVDEKITGDKSDASRTDVSNQMVEGQSGNGHD
jgi:hypothetical protein